MIIIKAKMIQMIVGCEVDPKEDVRTIIIIPAAMIAANINIAATAILY